MNLKLKRTLGFNIQMDGRLKFKLLSYLLNGCTTIGTIWFLKTNPQFANPWGISTEHWWLGYLIIRLALTFYDWLVIFGIEWVLGEDKEKRLLPTRTLSEKPVRNVPLDSLSYVFMFLNSFNEWIFVQRLCFFLWHDDSVAKSLSELNIWNTVFALAVIFIVNDIFYAPSHHLMHKPFLYPLIHQHHHRQIFPTNGYYDAGNEHPIEHLLGTLCIWAGILAANKVTGAHAFTIFMYFNIHAALAMLNHSPYNLEFEALGGWIQYSVGNHEMHHRKFTVNYAQYVMWYDHFMKTYSEYQGPSRIQQKQK